MKNVLKVVLGMLLAISITALSCSKPKEVAEIEEQSLPGDLPFSEICTDCVDGTMMCKATEHSEPRAVECRM